jgi:hypothetical protein
MFDAWEKSYSTLELVEVAGIDLIASRQIAQINLTGRVGIEIKGAAGMQAQRGGRTQGSDWIKECVADSVFLDGSRHGAEQSVTVEEPRYGDGKRAGGYVAESRKAPVIDLLLAALQVEIHGLDGERVRKVGRGVVKGKMAVGADAATDNIDGRGVELCGIIGGGLPRMIPRFEQMHGSEGKVIEDRATQPKAKALWRIPRQAEVLIHVEGGDTGPIDVLLLAKCGEHFALTGRSGKDHAYARLLSEACTNFTRYVCGRLLTHCAARLRYQNGR